LGRQVIVLAAKVSPAVVSRPIESEGFSMFAEFRKFAIRGNVVDLAVGVVIGAAFTAIINSLVKDVIMPPIGLLLGGIDFSNLFVVLKGSHAAGTLKAAQDAGAVTINYGQFFNAIVNFLIIAFVLFLMLRQLNKMMASKEPPPPPPEELAVLREIRDLLKERP
jgi:large conductance mechanosensitive channel